MSNRFFSDATLAAGEAVAWKLLLTVGLAGSIGLVSAGMLIGVKIDRRLPDHYTGSIVGEVHAGSNLRLREHVVFPADCIPRIARSLQCPSDDLSLPGEPVNQVITDSSVATTQGDTLLPTPPFAPNRVCRFHEEYTNQGCGLLSGIFTPNRSVLGQYVSKAVADPKGKVALMSVWEEGLPVMVLARLPIPTAAPR